MLLSCQSEKKLARGFIADTNRPSLYITFSSDWQMFFIKPQGTSSAETYARRYFPYRSYFLKNNGTTEVDSVFRSSMTQNLSSNSFDLYSDSTINDFLIEKSDKFIIEFVQMYIEEKTTPVGDTLYFANNSFIKFDTVISRIDLCFWLRINPVDDTILASPLLYASFPLIDYLDGAWDYDLTSDTYNYNYNFTEFGEADIYALFERSGKKIADYIYDYFLNLYLYNHMRRIPESYYSWNGNFLRRAGQERFVFMRAE
ncbi:MAG: hypothetical protein A2W93_15525 [Bacteroidetes bacterium GWF2_43_63]|nr:MAG: hypothetical protein A2W93_15525 [Bacteroidetes bacterium GWF2_43_63]